MKIIVNNEEFKKSGDTIESIVKEINENNNTNYDAKAVEMLLALENPPAKFLRQGSKQKGLNPEYTAWLESGQGDMWKNTIDYLKSIEPQKKMNPKQKRPNEDWSEWNSNYNSYIKTYEKFLKIK
jgi:hypothetical protein